jgi:hypothetical protein
MVMFAVRWWSLYTNCSGLAYFTNAVVAHSAAQGQLAVLDVGQVRAPLKVYCSNKQSTATFAEVFGKSSNHLIPASFCGAWQVHVSA